MARLNKTTFSHFDTVCSVRADVDEHALAEAERLCEHFELLYSRFDPRSALCQLNEAAGSWVDVDEELASAISTALRYCEVTDGLLDVTMGSVAVLWDFKQGIVPSQDEIDSAREHVDWQKIRVENNRVCVNDPRTVIDLGGVAKGIIADALVDFLVREGATSGCVNLGGNVAVIGSKPDGQPWNVGLRAPVPSTDPFSASTFMTIPVRDKSVVTSGIFERAFAYDGHLLHHILDPRTGAPAVTDILSATVISDNSTICDCLATALVIMGSEKALAFAQDRPEIEAVLHTTTGAVLRTPGV